jgi:hypothetical protein
VTDFRFDSLIDRGDLVTRIGVGRVIRGGHSYSLRPVIERCPLNCTGLNDGILGSNPMSLGEKSTLTISGYVSRQTDAHMPAHTD